MPSWGHWGAWTWRSTRPGRSHEPDGTRSTAGPGASSSDRPAGDPAALDGGDHPRGVDGHHGVVERLQLRRAAGLQQGAPEPRGRAGTADRGQRPGRPCSARSSVELALEAGAQGPLLVVGRPAGVDAGEADRLHVLERPVVAAGHRDVLVGDVEAHHPGVVGVQRHVDAELALAREGVRRHVGDHVGDHHVGRRADRQRDAAFGDLLGELQIVEQPEAVLDALAAQLPHADGDVLGRAVLAGVHRPVQALAARLGVGVGEGRGGRCRARPSRRPSRSAGRGPGRRRRRAISSAWAGPDGLSKSRIMRHRMSRSWLGVPHPGPDRPPTRSRRARRGGSRSRARRTSRGSARRRPPRPPTPRR